MKPPAPDIDLEPPPGWKWQRRHGTPLGLEPETASGVLQISSPAWARQWRGMDLDAAVRRFVAGSGLGEVVSVAERRIAYGAGVLAELVSEKS
jgi:hypothetical protein